MGSLPYVEWLRRIRHDLGVIIGLLDNGLCLSACL